MSKSNGPKQFLYVVRFVQLGDTHQYMITGDHDPTQDELIALLKLDYDPECDSIEAQRYDLDAIPKLPPK